MPLPNPNKLIYCGSACLGFCLVVLAAGTFAPGPWRAGTTNSPPRQAVQVPAPAAALAQTADLRLAAVARPVSLPQSGNPDSVARRFTHSPAACALPAAPTPVAGGARQRRIAFRTPASAEELSANMYCILLGSVRGGRWGVMAVSLTRGDTLFQMDAGAPLNPASTQKLFTAALALDQLGPAFQFQTTVLHSGTLDSAGVLRGDLILQGGGDPAFTSRVAPDDDPAPMDMLAELVRGSGVNSVTGNLIADPSAFDARLVPDGWLDRYLGAAYAAPVSALSLNSNVASVVIAPPGELEDSASATLHPPALTINLHSAVRTVPGSRGSNITLRRLDDISIQATGWIGERATPRRVPIVVTDPATFTAGAFRSALASSGVAIGGLTTVAPSPSAARHLAHLASPPMASLVTTMNRNSINHYAELIFRNSGRGADGLLAGSADAGFMRLSDFLATKVGTDPGSVYAVDGSGLSTLNRVTPRALVHLLSYAHRSPWGSVFHGSLPVAGESATLRDRMRNTAAQGNLHAKTGTTSAVVALSGYVTATNGEVLAFAFLYNGPDRDRARATIDQLGPAMAVLARR